MLDLLYGRWRSQAMYAGVRLDVFEAIGDTPVESRDVATRLALDPAMLYRLLRALASIGLLVESPDRRFALTAAGRVLRAAGADSLRDLVLLRDGPEHTAIWKHLAAIVRDGRQDGFVREYGRPAFEHATLDPGYDAAFDAGMSGHSRVQTEAVLAAIPAAEFAGVEHVCDIGGGQGHLLAHLLVRYPHVRGTVLDRAPVVERRDAAWAARLGVEPRCQYVAGDMFAALPAANAYILKMILHDWNDDECVAILHTARRSAALRARVFIVEHVIPGPNTPHFATLFDLHMMCWGTGRERTAAEYAALLDAAGWAHTATWYPPGEAIGVVAATRR